ncbi:MAG TPA: response regulator transcription factor [Candidatus Coprosoma intestinipullorum]|uniref:Response regulator transcription factor n=1 Tax=Candidatus Coprosoma intestinipullorum TaxID=2840752 RepID=A0A9D1CYD9_9FIRM|nr:response regulator transcription factor [Candidatus Coprosoma intestinipullorum]
MMNVLLIEDNDSIVTGLKYSLEQEKYKVFSCTNMSDTVKLLEKNKQIDIAIIDISLPDGNGFDLYKNYIKGKNIPSIFLTARDGEDDIVKGLELGVEDYMTKPFSTRELLARIKRNIMKYKNESVITIKGISFDFDKMEVIKERKVIPLTRLELKILHLLFSNLDKVVRRDYIIEKIWEWTSNDVNDNTVTVYMKRIREKIGVDIIITIKGIGYRIDDTRK